MPTNEERREIAASLRNVSGAPEWATTACCIAELIGEDDYPLWDSSKYLFERLAELIEPEPERTCRWKHIEGTWFMSECGERYDRVMPDNYCPNCGLRVRRDDE